MERKILFLVNVHARIRNLNLNQESKLKRTSDKNHQNYTVRSSRSFSSHSNLFVQKQF